MTRESLTEQLRALAAQLGRTPYQSEISAALGIRWQSAVWYWRNKGESWATAKHRWLASAGLTPNPRGHQLGVPGKEKRVPIRPVVPRRCACGERTVSRYSPRCWDCRDQHRKAQSKAYNRRYWDAFTVEERRAVWRQRKTGRPERQDPAMHPWRREWTLTRKAGT